jgi:hypothetical protein
MNEITYDKPQLVLLDAGSNYGYGACATGNNFKCNTGASFGSGATCSATGQYANATCGSGTNAGYVSCKSTGSSANCYCKTGGDASAAPPCTSFCDTGSGVTTSCTFGTGGKSIW